MLEEANLCAINTRPAGISITIIGVFSVLGYILEQQTGKSIYQLFKQEITDQLGMLDYQATFTKVYASDTSGHIPYTDGFYQDELSKSQYPAYRFKLSARDMALYGQLYLNKGKWHVKQLIPKSWIEASTQAYSVTNPYYGIGYGMLWYVLLPNKNRATESFYNMGTGVHMLGFYPGSNMVLVHRVRY